MTPLDTQLFNEFKHLDKLLRDARRTERGVSDYIDEMKATPRFESRSVLGWENDLNRLWRCRHIRNQLAHDDVPDYAELSRGEDVEFLKDFYTRVMNGDDPLARLRQNRTGERRRATPPPPPPYPYPPHGRRARPAHVGRSSRGGCLACLLVGMITFPVSLCALIVQHVINR